MTLFALLCALAADPGEVQLGHAMSEIEPGGELGGFRAASMDGDGAADLLVAVWSPARGRELLVYLQRRDGTFPAAADRRVEVKRDVIAFATADVREEAGDELLLFTRSACWSLSTAREGYVGNAARLFEWDLIAAVPDRKRVVHLGGAGDLDGDGSPEVLVPGRGAIAVFGQTGAAGEGPEPEAAFRERARIPLTARSGGRPRRSEHRFELSSGKGFRHERRGPFTGLVVDRRVEDGGGRRLIDAEDRIPLPHLADADGDGLRDLIALERANGGAVLRVHLQRRGRFAAEPDWRGPFESEGTLWPADVDGDGRVDLVAGGNEAEDEMRVRFFLNRGGSFDLAHPDQVMRFSGYGVRPELADLDGDGRPELVVSHYSVSVVGALRDGAVLRTLLIYAPGDGALFGRRPAFRLEERFSATEVKGLAQRVTFRADLRGSGRRHALHLDRDGALVARAVGDGLAIEEKPFWRFTPRRTVLETTVLELDGDGRSDLVLRHMQSLTVLVSR